MALRRHGPNAPSVAVFAFVLETKGNAIPITFDMWFRQQFFGGGHTDVYWPVHPASRVHNWRNVWLGIDVAPGFMPGVYVQAFGPVYIGDYTRIAPNVGIISSNHDILDGRKHNVGHISIGRYCWLGMNSVVLPNVTLGDFTIVAANAVVTRSYPEGYQVLAGSPAVPVKALPREDCVRYENEHRWHGFVRHEAFADFAKRELTPEVRDLAEKSGGGF